MGKQALNSHVKSKNHVRAVQATNRSLPVTSFFSSSTSCSDTRSAGQEQGLASTLAPEPPAPGVDKNQHSANATSSDVIERARSGNISTFFTSDEAVLRAEILWTIHTVASHVSFRAAASGVEMLKLMFPESSTAQKMQTGRQKLNYLAVFGLRHFFDKQLRGELRASKSPFVISFDESLN
jgi:hypothetical protein